MLTIEHHITIQSDAWASSDNSRLIYLQSQASMSIPVNLCSICMTYPDGVKVNPSDSIEVKLGIGDGTELVFSGVVESVEWELDQVRIGGFSSVRNLVAAHYNMYFDRPQTSDIVHALTSEAEVSIAQVDSGMPLDFYALGDQISAFDHIKKLADHNGFDLYTNPEDQLMFSIPIPGTVHPFQFGMNILSFEANAFLDGITGIDVYGESPASLGEGQDAVNWLTKREVKGSAGSDSGIRKQLIEPVVRSQQIATLMAQARLQKEKRRKKGEMKILGNPAIRIGDMALLSLMPVEAQNGLYKIKGITHRITIKIGFITILTLEEAI